MDIQALLTELDGLLARPPSAAAWRDICAALDRVDATLEPRSEVVLARLRTGLASWPDEIERTCPRRWLERYFLVGEPPPPWTVLCNGLDLSYDPLAAPSWWELGDLLASFGLDSVREYCPATRLRLQYHSDLSGVEDLAREFGSLRELSLRGARLGDDGWRALREVAALYNLRRLDLAYNDLRAPVLDEDLQCLEELDLPGNPLDQLADGLVVEGPVEEPTAWRILRLANCRMGAADLARLLALAEPGRVHTLVLDGTALDAEAVKVIAEAPACAQLARLSLVRCGLTGAALTPLRAHRLPLTELRLAGNPLGSDNAAIELPDASLVQLDLSHCGLTDFNWLFDGHRWSALASLDLSNRPLRSVRAHGRELSPNRFDDSDAAALTWTGLPRCLRYLDLSYNPLTEDGAGELAESPRAAQLQSLELRGLRSRSEDIAPLLARADQLSPAVRSRWAWYARRPHHNTDSDSFEGN